MQMSRLRKEVRHLLKLLSLGTVPSSIRGGKQEQRVPHKSLLVPHLCQECRGATWFPRGTNDLHGKGLLFQSSLGEEQQPQCTIDGSKTHHQVAAEIYRMIRPQQGHKQYVWEEQNKPAQPPLEKIYYLYF